MRLIELSIDYVKVGPANATSVNIDHDLPVFWIGCWALDKPQGRSGCP